MNDRTETKRKRNRLTQEGIEDTRQWFYIGNYLIQELVDDVYEN